MKHIWIVLIIVLLATPGCFSEDNTPSDELTLATTTSMRDSGLLETLIPEFEKSSGYSVRYIAVGTGAALELGENGDADLLIVHSPSKELQFINKGKGIDRTPFTWNTYVLIGPKNDPAKISNVSNITDVMNRISSSESCFVSRGDESGTHAKELELWQTSNISPKGDWYLSIGQGMGAAITIAYEKDCYTLSDKGTYLHREDINLEIFEFSSEELINIYSVIRLNTEKNTQANALRDYLVNNGQEVIENYTVNGQTLFNPISDLQ